VCLVDIRYWYIICRVEVINDLENRISHFGTNMTINNGGIMVCCDDVGDVSCFRDMHSCAFSVTPLNNARHHHYPHHMQVHLARTGSVR